MGLRWFLCSLFHSSILSNQSHWLVAFFQGLLESSTLRLSSAIFGKRTATATHSTQASFSRLYRCSSIQRIYIVGLSGELERCFLSFQSFIMNEIVYFIFLGYGEGSCWLHNAILSLLEGKAVLSSPINGHIHRASIPFYMNFFSFKVI